MKEPVELSKAQIDAFRKLYKMNARPVQPLNGRTVQETGWQARAFVGCLTPGVCPPA